MKRPCHIAIATFALLTGVSAYAQTTLTVSSWVPPTHAIVADMIVPWGQEIESATAGRVKLRLLAKAVG